VDLLVPRNTKVLKCTISADEGYVACLSSRSKTVPDTVSPKGWSVIILTLTESTNAQQFLSSYFMPQVAMMLPASRPE